MITVNLNPEQLAHYDAQVAKQVEWLKQHDCIIRIPLKGSPQILKKTKKSMISMT